MSRPHKLIPPMKGGFSRILNSIAKGSGAGKRASIKRAQSKPAAIPQKKK